MGKVGLLKIAILRRSVLRIGRDPAFLFGEAIGNKMEWRLTEGSKAVVLLLLIGRRREAGDSFE